MSIITAISVGSRQTRQRQAVLYAVRSANVHPDAQWVYDAIRRELPRISLGTVYRNLNLLVQHGLIRQIPTTGGYARFDGNLLPHVHLSCLSCDRIKDLPLNNEHENLMPAAEAAGFCNVSIQLDMHGICSDCS